MSRSWGRRAAWPRWAVWGKLVLGQDVAWACSRRWGASRRWPFDLTTNGLFSISKTGPALGSQGGKVARHRGLSAWLQGGGSLSDLVPTRRGARFQALLGWPLAKGAPTGPGPAVGLCGAQTPLPVFAGPGAGMSVGCGRAHLGGGRGGGSSFCAQTLLPELTGWCPSLHLKHLLGEDSSAGRDKAGYCGPQTEKVEVSSPPPTCRSRVNTQTTKDNLSLFENTKR